MRARARAFAAASVKHYNRQLATRTTQHTTCACVRACAPLGQYPLLPPSLEPLNSRACSLNPTAATIVASMAAEELYSSSFSSRPLRALLDAASSVCIRQGIPCDTVAHAAC
jgi:hypothetical protein